MYIAIFSFLLVGMIFTIIILVTELNRKKEELFNLHADSEAWRREILQLKKALDTLNILYFAHDLQGIIISLNEGAEKILHLSEDDLGKCKLPDFFLPEGRADWENHIKSILQKENSHGRFQLQLKDGEKATLRYTSVLNIVDEIPVTIHILAQPEEAILQNKWMDILPIPCFLVDGAGQIITGTHAHAESFPEELYAIRHLNEILDDEHLKKYRAFCTGREKNTILELTTPGTSSAGKKRIFGFWARQLHKELCLVCTIPDFSADRSSGKRSADYSEEQLHNLHGFISAMLGFTQIMADDLKEKRVDSPYLSDIQTAGEQALKILHMEPENTEDFVVRKTFKNASQPWILLVDDDAVLIKMNTIFIKQLGFKVIAANSAEQALSLFKKHVNKISLVISDIRIPDYSGYDLAYKIYEINPRVPVILVSGQVEEERTGAENIFKVLLKPVMPNRLKQVIFDGLKQVNKE